MRSVNAEGAKNRERMRVPPLNEAALWAAKLFRARALKLGAPLPEHHLIPFRIHRSHYANST